VVAHVSKTVGADDDVINPRQFNNARNSFQSLLRPTVKEFYQNPQTFVTSEFFVEIAVRFSASAKLRNFFAVFSTTRL
jgi:hypothetical protein